VKNENKLTFMFIYELYTFIGKIAFFKLLNFSKTGDNFKHRSIQQNICQTGQKVVRQSLLVFA